MVSTGEKDKRRQILKAAVKVFSQKGFHEAKVDEIAELADVGKGTVYEYFSSKRELFQEMFKSGVKFYTDAMKKDLGPELSCREQMLRLATMHMKFVDKFKDLARVTMLEHTDFDEDFRKWIWDNRNTKIEMIEQIITEGVKRGEFRQVNAKAAALAYSGILGALFSPVVFANGGADYKELLEPVLDILFNGLSAEGQV